MKKTKINALLCCILAIICSINFTACKKDGVSGAITGHWQLKSVINYTDGQAEHVNAPEIGNSMIIIGDYTYHGKIYGTPLNETGTWSRNGNTFEMKDDANNMMTFTISCDGDTLILTTTATVNGHNYKTEYTFSSLQ